MNECGICGNPVDKDDPVTWKQVQGWVGGPRKDSMRLRTDTGKYAHDACVLKEQRGVAQDQQELFDPAAVPGQADDDADEMGLFE